MNVELRVQIFKAWIKLNIKIEAVIVILEVVTNCGQMEKFPTDILTMIRKNFSPLI